MHKTFTYFITWLFFAVISHSVSGQGVPNANESSTYKPESVAPLPSTSISVNFSLTKDAFVTLKIFDPLGNPIAQPIKGNFKAGENSIPLDALNLREGVYFYRLSANDHVETKKLVVRK